MGVFEDDITTQLADLYALGQAKELVFGNTTIYAIKDVGPDQELIDAGIEVEVDRVTARTGTHLLPSGLTVDSQVTFGGTSYRVHDKAPLPPDGLMTVLLLAES
jgi:hypothetical protein